MDALAPLHSGRDAAKACIAELKPCLSKNYDLVICSPLNAPHRARCAIYAMRNSSLYNNGSRASYFALALGHLAVRS